MTTMTEVRLPEALQGLIDARLDTIDRMLLGRLPRGERMAIVGQVEEQLHEMLGEHQGEDWSREDILEILGRLDPPEAYLPESGETGMPSTPMPASRPIARAGTIPARRSEGTRQARLGGVLGIIALVLALLAPPILWGFCLVMNSEMPLIVGGGMDVVAVMVLATIGLIQSIRHRAAGGWAIAGLTLNIVSMVAILMLGFSFALLLVG
ncbi:MAG: hypothetical protein U0800_24035 [Isosphaeraceae bacterium]